jgi:hypothetical protein
MFHKQNNYAERFTISLSTTAARVSIPALSGVDRLMYDKLRAGTGGRHLSFSQQVW